MGFKLKKYGLRLCLFVLMIMVSLVLYMFYQMYDSEDKVNITLKTPYGNAHIQRDALGVPHIKADTDLSSFFALGYMHAKNRLWQMEFQ